MKEIKKGHVYSLQNLKSDTTSILSFFQDPLLHEGEGIEGPSVQEVLRACIARVIALHEEKPHAVNPQILTKLRECILLFEFRALEKKIINGFEIESVLVDKDGHLSILSNSFENKRDETIKNVTRGF